ncbi:phage tail protein [Candidatus Symbiopectobacterium sp. 'North America']|uniref:phage tail protein n=1 Tax=Candidatus Symbiopectobacterium sp. 'North America' TaxID=2794574 RepID=UPI001FD22D8C|nr:phage tail protein [Candidatus Symbiopectobacterium sp. 'North America']
MSVDEFAGIPLPFPGTVAPAGFLKCNGQAFNKTTYPILAARYPTGYLPDLRGEFIRGLDDGRGVDSGRVLLSEQGDAIRNITGTISFSDDDSSTYAKAIGSGVFSVQSETKPSFQGGGGNPSTIPAVLKFDASTVVPTAADNRPRNIAFNYIVRAA